MKRITAQIPISLINCDFKPNCRKARRFAGLLQNGVEFKPVHLQRLKDGTYKICDGRTRFTAHKMLDKVVITAKFSTRVAQV